MYEKRRQAYNELQKNLDSSKDKVCKLQRHLDNIIEQLGDAKINKHDDNRRIKKQEVVESFKKAYPGVVRFLLLQKNC